MNLEGFIDVFNVLDQQTAILIDDNYTFDAAAPIVNGTPQDLKFAKTANGAPITKNPNFGQPLAYQDADQRAPRPAPDVLVYGVRRAAARAPRAPSLRPAEPGCARASD